MYLRGELVSCLQKHLSSFGRTKQKFMWYISSLIFFVLQLAFSKIRSNGSTNSNSTKTPTSGTNHTTITPVSSAQICSYPSLSTCGLDNLGNTCYANAAIQCLAYLPLLRGYLVSRQYKMDINKDNVLGTGGKIAEELGELFRMLWAGKYGCKAPSRFRAWYVFWNDLKF